MVNQKKFVTKSLCANETELKLSCDIRRIVPRCRLSTYATAVELFITLARQSGARCQMNLEILTVLMSLNDS